MGDPFSNCSFKEMLWASNPFSNTLLKSLPPRHRKKKVILISGPTGVGKTDLSLKIAHAVGGEVISADSMQVYRGMDIGTAKVCPKESLDVPHHLIDSREINESYNAFDFYNEAMHAIAEIIDRDHVPIVVGGTGFYIHTLINGPPQGPPANEEVRLHLETILKEKGSEHLYRELKEIDPEYAQTITSHDKNKIVRGLEIHHLTGKKVSDFKPVKREDPYDFRCWFIYLPREILYPRVEMRCDLMIAKGLIKEVKELLKIGLLENPSAAQSIGYRQCIEYLKSAQTAEDFEYFVSEFKKASRHYVKRQFTWFRKEPLFRWLNMENLTQDAVAEIILQDFEFSF